VKHCFPDYHDLLACDAVDAVVVVLPDHLHRAAAVATLESGKHLLLEKPMALTVADAEAIVEARKSAAGKFMLNLSNRWMPAFAAGKTKLESGAFGEVRYVWSRMANRADVPLERLRWLERSHIAHWIGVHRLDIARWYVGKEIVRVRGVQRKGVLATRGFDNIDFFQATVEFDGGAVMTLEGNWILPPSNPSLVDSRFYCLCENGVIDVDRSRSELSVAGPETFELSTPLAGNVLGRQSGFTMDALGHFVDCCLEGKDPLVTAEDGLALTRALCAIVESCEKDGEIIKL
jgi:predicted dehydrogenase